MHTAHWFSRITPLSTAAYQRLLEYGNFDPYGQRIALHKLFDHLPPQEKPKGSTASFLFRAEEQDGMPLLQVLSPYPPKDPDHLWHIDTQPYAPDFPADTALRFRLRVNPTVSRGASGNSSSRHDVVTDAQKSMSHQQTGIRPPSLAMIAASAGAEWLLARTERMGIRIEASALQISNYRKWRQQGGRGAVLSMLDFSGTLTVLDSDLFRHALLNGIGPGKAFGCGLLLVERIPG